MMSRFGRLTIASFIGGLCYFIIGWLVFELLLGGYMASNTIHLEGFKKQESSILMLIFSCLAYSVLLSFIYGYLTDIATFKKGAFAGSIIGILIAIMADLYWYATSHFFNSLAPVLADVCAAGLTVGFTGGVIGSVLGRIKK